ncbi:MAG: DUF1080 domain-containing protein [Phycisphaerales bacterium JB037]
MRPLNALCASFAVSSVLLGSSPAALAVRVHQPEASAQPEADRGWEPLFNGRDLTGWTTAGDPQAWGVENGEIVTVKPGQGWWLRTERMFRDFDLELEFFLPEGANSGIGLRGSSNGDPAFTGLEVQILDTHGEEPGFGNCGAVYNAIPPASMAVHEPGNWNSYRIRLVGDTLDVWLNGEKIHDAQRLDDRGYFRSPEQTLPLNARLTTGYISIQDHGHACRFRNIRIRDLSPDRDPGGWTSLIPSEGTTGWTARGGGEWTVEGGTLIGRNGPGHLFTDRMWSDLEIRAMVRVNERGNSGLYFRTVPRPEDPNTWPLGYEAQVDNHDPKNFTGVIYDRAWSNDHDQPITRDNAWFDYRIIARGDHIQTFINGVPMVDTRLDLFDLGHIVLQTHHQGNQIEWRDIRVRELRSPDEAGDRPGVVPMGR